MSLAITAYVTSNRAKVVETQPAAQGKRRGWLGQLTTFFESRRDYGRTVRELSACSDRELQDLGIFRSDIRAIARQTASASRS